MKNLKKRREVNGEFPQLSSKTDERQKQERKGAGKEANVGVTEKKIQRVVLSKDRYLSSKH